MAGVLLFTYIEVCPLTVSQSVGDGVGDRILGFLVVGGEIPPLTRENVCRADRI